MCKFCLTMLALTVSAIWFGTSHAQQKLDAQTEPQSQTKSPIPERPQSAPELIADANAGFSIEFLGKEPTADWARVAAILTEKKLVELETLQLRKGQDPCSAVLEQLKFRSVGLRCSDEMRAFIRKLNSDLPLSAPVGAPVKYPKLPIEEISWYAGFDHSLPGEADRYNKISEAWKAFKTGETSRGSQVQVKFRGFRTNIVPSDSAETVKTLESVERYDPKLQRFDTRVLPFKSTPLIKPFSMTDPIGWGELCLKNSPPPPPSPPYIVLLGGTKEDLKCVAQCKQTENCPEIVLIDQTVAPHPDVAHAFGAAPASGTPRWCPFVDFDPKKHHGTHMAGLMVSSGVTSAFSGLAPNALLEGKDIGTAFEQKIKEIASQKNLEYARSNVIFVFASQFPGSKDVLINSVRRYATPTYVADVLNNLRLWIVAAGQSEQPAEPMEIGTQTNASPMNLGDRGTVLVVTACENCYSDQPVISSWANYSGSGLVNIAAAGGTADKQIPSPVSGLDHGLAYGTSQATALVGGLAAAMMSCYPQSYSAQSLKTRLLATSRPPPSRDVAQKISAGIVDANKALLDPNVHWIARRSTLRQESMKEVLWCKQDVAVKDLADGQVKLIDVRSIRRLIRNKAAPELDAWFVFYQRDTNFGQTVRVSSLVTPAEKLRPLLHFRQGSATQALPATPIDDIEELLIGLAPKATTQVVPPEFAGCK